MIKRKIAIRDTAHVERAKEVMLNKVNQINILPEEVRPNIIAMYIDEFRMVIDLLDPTTPHYDRTKSEHYSGWSDEEIADYRDNFLRGVILPRLEDMKGGGGEGSAKYIVEDLLGVVDNKPGYKESLNLMIDSLKYNGAKSAIGFARMFLLSISREDNMRADAFDLMLDLFRTVGGREAERILNNFIMDMEAELNDEGRSFLFKLSSKSFNNLILFANHLDSKGLVAEANYLDSLIRKSSR